jgi:hypothetical protein
MSASISLENGHLSDALVAQYWRDGFLFPLDGLTAEEAAAARVELEKIEADWLDAGLPLPLNTYKRVNAHLVMPLVDRIARNPWVVSDKSAQASEALGAWILRGNKRAPLFKSSGPVQLEIEA